MEISFNANCPYSKVEKYQFEFFMKYENMQKVVNINFLIQDYIHFYYILKF